MNPFLNSETIAGRLFRSGDVHEVYELARSEYQSVYYDKDKTVFIFRDGSTLTFTPSSVGYCSNATL